MYMEWTSAIEGSTAYHCYFPKKRLIKILHEIYGINDFHIFLRNYIWDDTEYLMAEFERRGWNYKKVPVAF